MSVPVTPSSSNQNTERDPSSSSSTTTVTLTGLPPNTVKADIHPVFQRFGQVTRIFVRPDSDGRRADVVFSDVRGVKHTLHAFAEKPLLVRGREITVFRKNTKINKVYGMDTDTPSRAIRTGRDDGAIFVSNFPPTMTQQELLKALEPFGKYEEFVMRMSFALSLSLSRKWAF
jgi:RNA recognition motif-containing protein